MGLKDWMAGTRYPDANADVMSAPGLRAALLGLNDPGRNWVVRDGAPEQLDLVAEWRMDESRQGVFFMNRLDRVLKILMRFDESSKEVRAIDQEWEASWHQGLPKILGNSSSSQGNLNIKKNVRVRDANGVVHHFTYSTADMKDPLRNAVTAAGWTWRGCFRVP